MRLSLNPPGDPDAYPFVHQVRTRFAETDAMGIIHHGALIPYLEEARAAFLRFAGHPYDEVRAAGIDFTVLELYVRYRRPLRFDEVVDIHVMVDGPTRTVFEVGYLLQVVGETRADAVTVHGAVDGDGRGRRMPGWVAQLAGTRPDRGEGRADGATIGWGTPMNRYRM
ncbi:MAG: thioesterase family protein [Acidimicrobiales bacterium]